jgi:hypothetical protein
MSMVMSVTFSRDFCGLALYMGVEVAYFNILDVVRNRPDCLSSENFKRQ